MHQRVLGGTTCRQLQVLRRCHQKRCHQLIVTSTRQRSHVAYQPAPNSVDVIALGNICLDIFIPVPSLPSQDHDVRRELLDKLTNAPPSEEAWEVGGNCNFMIAAARLGLRVGSMGHVGNDVYGNYVNRVLQAESIEHNHAVASVSMLDRTLVCFVLVDPASRHAFCSRYDFGPWPLLQGITSLPDGSMQRLKHTRALFTNGFVFDELPLEIVQTACREAIHSGAAVFFDPGPRCFTMLDGSRREALHTLMDLSDVVLMTEEEAKIVTGHDDPELAARQVLERPGARTEWCIVKLGRHGALLRSKSEQRSYRSQGMQVDVQDTVGCGDSFASAIVLGFINHHSIPSTLALANAVGAATATGRGAGRNVATADKVFTLLESEATQEALASERSSALLQAVGNLRISTGLRQGDAVAAA